MTKLKTLLVGSAITLAIGGAAVAADLPAAEPVEYVRICDAYGAGYFFIPGTDTCLRVSGYVRIQAFYHSDNTAVTNWTGFGTELVTPAYAFSPDAAPGLVTTPLNLVDQLDMGVRALMRFDARSRTEWGVLRSFFEFAATSSSNAINGSTLQLRYGFVQFGPVTAGVTDSFFNFDNGVYYGDVIGDRTTRVMLFAYTAAFGNGISATISLEDPTVPAGAGQGGIGGTTGGIIPNGTGLVNDASQLPDLVGNIRISQEWGSAQLSGVVGQRRYLDPSLVSPVGTFTNATFDETVWAVLGGLKINLPGLSRGSNVQVTATYGEGSTNFVFSGLTAAVLQSARDITGAIDERSLSTVEFFSIYGHVVYFFTPALRGSLYGAYASADYGINGYQYATNSVRLDSTYQVGVNLQWTPVRNLDMGIDIFYTHNDYNAIYNAVPGAVNAGRVDTFEEDGWGAIFRIQRSF